MSDEQLLRRPVGWWIKEADARLDAAFDASLAGGSVDRRAWQVLATLARSAAPRWEVAAGLASFDDVAVVTCVVDDLRERGWVEESSDGLLQLTPDGIREQQALAPLVEEVRSKVAEALPEEDDVTLVRLLAGWSKLCADTRLSENVCASGDSRGHRAAQATARRAHSHEVRGRRHRVRRAADAAWMACVGGGWLTGGRVALREPSAAKGVTVSVSERTTKLTLAGAFLGGLGGFSALLARRDEQVQIAPLDLVMLGLATYRSGRLIAYERVAAPLREPVTETVPDGSGAGEAVVATGDGWRWAFGELVSCPVCVGTWVAAGLVYGLHLAPRPTRAYLAVMSATGLAQLLSESTEALTWSSRSARKQAAPVRGI